MKKFILSVMVSFVALVASAQVYVGGSFTFAHDGEYEFNVFEIAPEVGYSFNDMWGIGGAIGFTHVNPVGGVNTNTFYINPYARFTYFRKGILSLFLDGSLGFSTSKYKDHGDADNGVKIGIEPGVAVNVTEHFGFVAKYGFLGYRDKYTGAVYRSSLNNTLVYTDSASGIDFSPSSLSFGFYYTF